jgi:ribonuclease VapC
MMHTAVLDAYALMAYLEGEKGADAVTALFVAAHENEGARIVMSSVNWGEVYYIVLRERGKACLSEVLSLISKLPIEIVDPTREDIIAAAELKATRKMSYADCFAAATAKRLKATLVTGDKEFESMSKEIKIRWI